MAVAGLLLYGIGPGGSVPLLLLDGLIPGAAPPPPPPPPPGQAVIPHDDYDGPRWYRRASRYDTEERIKRARKELGLIPEPAQQAIAKAAQRIAEAPVSTVTERQAFDFVAEFQTQYLKAFKSRIGTRAQRMAAEAVFRAEVRRKLVAKDDEDVLMIVAAWL